MSQPNQADAEISPTGYSTLLSKGPEFDVPYHPHSPPAEHTVPKRVASARRNRREVVTDPETKAAASSASHPYRRV